MHDKDEEFSPKEINLVLRQAIQMGLIELHFNGEEFCFSVTKHGEETYHKFIGEDEEY